MTLKPVIEANPMTLKPLKKLLLIALLTALPAAALAASYVTDKLEVTLRTGPGLDYRIVTMLKAGQRLEVLGDGDGWTNVRTAGKEGWLVSRFISEGVPLRPQLAAAKAELDKAVEAEKTQAAKLDETRKELKKASSELNKTTKKRNALQKELNKWMSVNAGAVEMEADNQRMNTEATEIGEEVGALRIENRQLKARQNTYWFISGAIILLLGWALGHLYSSSKGKHKGGFRF